MQQSVHSWIWCANRGRGAVLTQDGRPLAYYGKALGEGAVYFYFLPMKKKLMALVTALKKWTPYRMDKHFFYRKGKLNWQVPELFLFYCPSPWTKDSAFRVLNISKNLVKSLQLKRSWPLELGIFRHCFFTPRQLIYTPYQLIFHYLNW